MKDSTKVKYYLDKTGFFAESAVILLALSIIFRAIGCLGLWQDRVNFIMLFALPAFCCLLMILCILLFGKKGFFLSCIPVLLGVAFFVYQSLRFDDWVKTVLCVMLYLVIAVVYTATVFSWLPTKWLLPPLFGLPFLYQVIMLDIPALRNTAKPVTFADGMQEMSILGIMAAMFCVSMGLKKRIVEKKRRKAAEPEEPAPKPAPAAEPAPAVQVPPAPQSAPEAEAAQIQTDTLEENPFLSDEPYTPVLTLEPDPVEPDEAEASTPDGSEHE